MNVNVGLWDKLSKVVIFLLFVAALTAVFFWYLPLIQWNQNYRKRLLSYDAEIGRQEKVSHQLKVSIDAMQNDPKTVERLVRERLGWAKPGEMVVRFQGTAAGANPRR